MVIKLPSRKKLTKLHMLVSRSVMELLLLQNSSWILVPLSWYLFYLIPVGHMPFCPLLGSTLVSYGTRPAPPFMLFFITSWRKMKNFPLGAFSWERQQVHNVTAVPGSKCETGEHGGSQNPLCAWVRFFHTNFGSARANLHFIAHSGELQPRLRWDSAHSFCAGIFPLKDIPGLLHSPLACHSPPYCCPGNKPHSSLLHPNHQYCKR